LVSSVFAPEKKSNADYVSFQLEQVLVDVLRHATVKYEDAKVSNIIIIEPDLFYQMAKK